MSRFQLSRRRWLGVTGASALALPPLFGQDAGTPARVRTEAFGPRVVEKEIDFHTRDVPNGEPSLENLVASHRTPVERFYVRSHAPAPKVDLGSYRVKVEGLVERELSLSIDHLLGLDQTSTLATLTCAGNRRTEHNAVEPVTGVPWGAGAIGTTEWSGVPLATLLAKAGVRDAARHVWFEGIDEIEKGGETIGFGGSIPIGKALARHGDVPGALVALRMGGAPLTADHGFPVRTVVPGYIGARSVKWLGRIVVSDRPSPNHYLATAYKVVERDTPLAWEAAGPIYDFPVNSVIASIRPLASSENVAGRAWQVRGYALPPGDGRTIARVELSVDGENWRTATISGEPTAFCWVLWEATVRTPEGATSLTVRATDSEGRVQPRCVPWNLKGYVFNAWHTRDLPAG